MIGFKLAAACWRVLTALKQKLQEIMVRVISVDELAKHTREKDCWIAVHGKVYDVTPFLKDHPGGPEVVVRIAGRDVSDEYEDVGHSDFARDKAQEFEVGTLVGHENDTGPTGTLLKTNVPKWAQEAPPSRSVSFPLVPVVVAGVSVALVAAYMYMKSRQR
ncbi:unnamed protein product [Vitrella brassicaformis CCMP3155]|uniref:Cytochrome b5 heme-binding domain-containing protein n=2 Tax=Vitrella brassicaformis TaxID=1169539 RepID=A0A0G4EL92_VITBC|nr:unnamed protein product [Vitrella brassicaformis CCMP3155]|eukprot:CEL98182.1 unnamed protein product [Vitrella brassicaformis CCMP3155]